MPSRRPTPILIQLLIPLAVYVAAIIPAALLHRDQINPDAVVYIRFANYIAHGDFAHSISGYWSPLISWCIAPLLIIKMDGLHAARMVLAIWGGLLLTAFYFFMLNFEGISKRWRFAAMILMAFTAVQLSIVVISPDLILAACLFAYFAVVTNDRLIEKKSTALVGGLIAGVAYLAKAYALPFFLLHFTVTVLLRYVTSRRDEPRLPMKRFAGAYVAGLIGFAVISLPWIGVLSNTYQKFTISTTGAKALAIMHPDNATQTAPVQFGMAPPPYISLKETPDALPYTYWSPFENDRYFKHQMAIVNENALVVCEAVEKFDRVPVLPRLKANRLNYWYLHFGLAAFVVSPFAAIWLTRRQRQKALWLLLTAGAYCSGLLFVFCEARYLEPILLPIGLVLALHLALTFKRADGTPAGGWRHLSALLIVVSFAIVARERLWLDLGFKKPTEVPPSYRDIAQQVASLNVSGPIASSDWSKGLFVAYHMNRPYLGFPYGKTDEECAQLLADSHAAILMRWPEPPIVNHSDSPAVKARKLAARRAFILAERLAGDGTWDEKIDLTTEPTRTVPTPRRKKNSTRPAIPSTAAAPTAPDNHLRVFVRDFSSTQPARDHENRASVSTTNKSQAGQAVLIPNVPFIEQLPDFCGEACAAMWLNHLGTKWTQEQVFDLCDIDPELGRGVYSEELGPGLKRIGFDVGLVWYPIRKTSVISDLEAQWQAIYDDLRHGIPSIVVTEYSNDDDDAHMRLVLGYDPADDTVIYHEPAEKNGAYQHMKREKFLKLMPMEEDTGWMVERIRLDGKNPKPAPEGKSEKAERAQKVMDKD